MRLINQRLCDQQTNKSLSSAGVQDHSNVVQVAFSVPFPQCVTLSKPKVVDVLVNNRGGTKYVHGINQSLRLLILA